MPLKQHMGCQATLGSLAKLNQKSQTRIVIFFISSTLTDLQIYEFAPES